MTELEKRCEELLWLIRDRLDTRGELDTIESFARLIWNEAIEAAKTKCAKLQMGEPVMDYLFVISESTLDSLKKPTGEEK